MQAIKSIFDALSPFINIFISGLIIDALYQKQDLENLIFLVFVMVSTNLFIYLINGLLKRSIDVRKNSFGQMINNLITQKINSMDYQSIENPETHNLRQRMLDMQNWSNGGLPQLLAAFENLIKQIFVILFSTTLIFNAFIVSTANNIFINSPAFSVLVIALIIASVIFSMYINATSQKKSFEMGKGVMLNNRIFIYYDDLMKNYKMGKDMRMYNQKALILQKGWGDMFTNATIGFSKRQKMATRYDNINLAVSTAISALVYVFVALRALSGLYSIGSIVRYVGGIHQFI
jgi:ATP-binding cassette subfamily B protein